MQHYVGRCWIQGWCHIPKTQSRKLSTWLPPRHSKWPDRPFEVWQVGFTELPTTSWVKFLVTIGRASLVTQWWRTLPMLETQVPSLGWEDPLEKEMTTHSSILAQEITWTEKPGGCSPWGCRVRHDLTTKQQRWFACFFIGLKLFHTARPLPPLWLGYHWKGTLFELHRDWGTHLIGQVLYKSVPFG